MPIGVVKKPQQIKSPHIKQAHTKRRIKLKEKRESRKENEQEKRKGENLSAK
jgi:hypothetical protein